MTILPVKHVQGRTEARTSDPRVESESKDSVPLKKLDISWFRIHMRRQKMGAEIHSFSNHTFGSTEPIFTNLVSLSAEYRDLYDSDIGLIQSLYLNISTPYLLKKLLSLCVSGCLSGCPHINFTLTMHQIYCSSPCTFTLGVGRGRGS